MATAPIRPLAWEPPYAMGVAIEKPKKLKKKNIIREKEGLYIKIKRSIQEEDITIVNIYAPNIGSPY